ncbi:hypothetical protein Misp01_70070 [Microtetraspora sp. NBRC 13810]|uniref:uridine kinase family protein n=1 Tax=Microtetraspora sp. NBRC 13810 TaxID=3030990 RepID=UPI00249FDBFF|nr:AAA family ATPase [Microtetraspora sp. NBRC 13810]GLW11879.1 hypothetical protein Misp01_70070 [Microtetraspora sp. NBRC 13810]
MADKLSHAGLADLIRTLEPSCGPVRLVAVDGPAGSGKTTFAGRLARALDAQVVHSDDFPVPWDQPPEAWFRLVEEQILRRLARGLPGRYRRYDWTHDDYAEWVDVPVAPALILEGVSTARRATADLTAFTVWVEAPADLRLRRVLARDGAHLEPRWRTWMRQEDAWFAADSPRERADLLVDGAATCPEEAVPVLG